MYVRMMERNVSIESLALQQDIIKSLFGSICIDFEKINWQRFTSFTIIELILIGE
jgi:hypothetical protein